MDYNFHPWCFSAYLFVSIVFYKKKTTFIAYFFNFGKFCIIGKYRLKNVPHIRYNVAQILLCLHLADSQHLPHRLLLQNKGEKIGWGGVKNRRQFVGFFVFDCKLVKI